MESRRNAVQIAGLALVDKLDDGFLDAIDIGNRFVNGSAEHPAILAIPQLVGSGAQRVDLRLLTEDPLIAPTAAQAVQRRLDHQQRFGDIHEHLLVAGPLASDDGLHVVDLLLDNATRNSQPEHAQGIGNAPHGRRQRGETLSILTAAADEQIQSVFDCGDVLLDSGRHSGQDLVTGTEHPSPRLRNLLIVEQQVLKSVLLLNRGHALAYRLRAAHVVEQILDQLSRRLHHQGFLAADDHSLHLPIDLPKQHLGGRAAFQPTLAQGFDQAAAYPPDGASFIVPRSLVEPIQDILHLLEVFAYLLLAQITEQRHLIAMPQATGGHDQIAVAGDRTRNRPPRFKVGREQRAFREQTLAARGPQVVEQR